MFYSIFCTLKGKEIASISGDYADDEAAIATARFYQQSSAADTIRVHRDAPLYPLGELIAELKALPPDPEGRNGDRAEWAEAAIRQFQIVSGTDWDDTLKDLLCNLMHFADRRTFEDGKTYFDFDSALETARMHYEAETTTAD